MSDSGWRSEKQRKELRREAKLHQERAAGERDKLDRMSRTDPSRERQQERMISAAQDCGRRYAVWLKAQGRQGQVRENG